MTKPKYKLRVGDKFTNPYANYTASVMDINEADDCISVVITPDDSNVGESDEWMLSDVIYGLETGDYVMKPK